MSDSEEEFASADEGEVASAKAATAAPSASVKPASQDRKEPQKSKKRTSANQASGNTAQKPDVSKGAAVYKADERSGAKAKGKNSKQKRKGNKNKKDAAEDVKETEAVDFGDQTAVANAVAEEVSKVTLQDTADDEGQDAADTTCASLVRSKLAAAIETDSKESTQSVSESQNVEKESSEKSDLNQDKQTGTFATSDVLDQTIDRDVSLMADTSAGSDTNTEDSSQKQTGSGWGGWSSWGTSLVSVATASVSTFTNQVGEGFSTVMETVESSLGAPPPEELVKSERTEEGEERGETNPDKESKEVTEGEAAVERKEDENEEPQKPKKDGESSSEAKAEGGSEGGGWLSGWGVSNLTHLVTDTGKSLVTGSLDVLETIGKKTYDALSEHDPGLKAAIKGGNKPNLSSILRDAKVQAEENSRLEAEYEELRQAQFGAMFDEYQGLVNLEALEMLSNQAENRVQALLAIGSPETLADLKKKLVELKDAFELEDLDEDEDNVEHDFPKLISTHLSEFHKGTSPAKLSAVQAKVHYWLSGLDTEEGSSSDPKEIYKLSIQALAELTAKTVEQFHKAGELLLLQRDHDTDMLDRAKALASVTKVVCTEVGILSSKFTECLNKAAEGTEESESVNTYITSVFLEASNSSTYIQDAFQLLLPVVQQATIEQTEAESLLVT